MEFQKSDCIPRDTAYITSRFTVLRRNHVRIARRRLGRTGALAGLTLGARGLRSQGRAAGVCRTDAMQREAEGERKGGAAALC